MSIGEGLVDLSGDVALEAAMMSFFDRPCWVRRVTYWRVRLSWRMRDRAMMCRARLAWRSRRPELAGMGAAAHRWAKAASERSRWGLSPAVTSSCPATSGPMPGRASRSGAAVVSSGARVVSRSLISVVSCLWRRARDRSAVLVALVGSAVSPLGRSRAQALIRAAAVRPRSCSRDGAGAVTIRLLIWLIVWVRALMALLRATRRARIASTGPSWVFGTVAARPVAAAHAAA